MLMDYTNFFDISDKENKEKIIKANYDFNTYFGLFLNDIGCNPYYIRSICNTVFASMTSDKSYYHTPVHILSIISFCEKNQIELKNWEKLAILFHDAIYRPESIQNEIQSIQFMFSILNDTGIDENLKTLAGMAIQSTSLHLEEHVDPDHNLLMDLDLSGFSNDKIYFDIQNLCIKKEFCQESLGRYGGVKEKQYNEKRIKFLTALKNKKSLYRTELFLNKFEQKAQENLINSINGI